MKVKYLRIAVSSFLAMMLLLVMAVPVFAIDDPDALTIHTVFAYRHCLEEDDMLLLIDETIDYSITGEPTETATDAYLVRLINATTSAELASVAPYSYHNSGYDRGLVAIYFSAADLPALGWNPVAPGYTIQLTGNLQFSNLVSWGCGLCAFLALAMWMLRKLVPCKFEFKWRNW